MRSRRNETPDVLKRLKVNVIIVAYGKVPTRHKTSHVFVFYFSTSIFKS